jgi:hypothetical protein
VNFGNAVNLGWVQAVDGPTNEQEGYLSMSSGVADGSVAVDVPAIQLGPWFVEVTEVPIVSDKEGDPPPQLLTHKHFLHLQRGRVPALAFSLWLRAAPTTAVPVNVVVALWAIPDDRMKGAPTAASRRLALGRPWQRVEVVHGPFEPYHEARCEVYSATVNRPIHIAGASMH